MTASCCWKMTAVCVIPPLHFLACPPLVPRRATWMNSAGHSNANSVFCSSSPTQVDIGSLYSVWMAFQQPNSSLPPLLPFLCPWLAALLHLLLCLLSLFSCLCWITPGYCVAVQGAEMLSVTGPRSNLMARTCRESHAKEMSTFILHFIETVVFSSVLFFVCFNSVRNPCSKIGLLKLKGIGRAVHIAYVRLHVLLWTFVVCYKMIWLHWIIWETIV